MIAVELLFWIPAAIILYVYVGYPCLIAVWARTRGRQSRRLALTPAAWPSISVVVAARNEAERLPGRVADLLAQHYPGWREIIVVSDGSVDAPAAALAPFGDRVQLIEVPAGGKPTALNAGVAAARGEIVVFADARQRFAPGAIAFLVSNFSDPQVGAATGELVLDSEHEGTAGTGVAEGVGLYWRFEKWLRRNESRVWSTLGATGAIYAMRRSLWRPLPAPTLLDDVLAPMRAVLDGFRVVVDERAVAYDRASSNAAAERRRKTRTLAGNYQILAQEPRLLVPFANPVWLQYVSHKVGRLLVPWALVAVLIASGVLTPAGWIYTVAFGVQLAFYGLAVAGGVFNTRERLAGVASAFVVMNFSAIAGIAALRSGREGWR
jgi:poly-beta-1,6-N-acetyl-D-glucosamine synthase